MFITICIAASFLLLDSALRFVLLCLRFLRSTPPANVGDNVDSNTPSFLILIPARDEEGTIDRTVRSLRSSMEGLRGGDLWIIADQCRDSTAAEARAAGAQVAVRASGPLGKGQALGWWFQRYEEVWAGKEAVVVLDADSDPNPGCLAELLAAIANGSAAAQAFVCAKSDSVDGRIAGYSELLAQCIDDEARRSCDWPVPLRGTGMAFRADLLVKAAPRLHTLAEDLELTIILAADGKRVTFVPAATVRDPKPRSSRDASRQRARWLRGQFQVVLGYRREILWVLLRGGAGARLLLLSLIFRPKTPFVLLRVLALATVLWPFATVGLLMDAAYYLAGICAVVDRRQYILDILALPRYGWVWLNSLVLMKSRKRWLRAAR